MKTSRILMVMILALVTTAVTALAKDYPNIEGNWHSDIQGTEYNASNKSLNFPGTLNLTLHRGMNDAILFGDFTLTRKLGPDTLTFSGRLAGYLTNEGNFQLAGGPSGTEVFISGKLGQVPSQTLPKQNPLPQSGQPATTTLNGYFLSNGASKISATFSL